MRVFSRFFIFTLGIVALAVLAAWFGLSALQHHHNAVVVHHVLACYWWVFALWRYALLAVVFWKWPALCSWFGRRYQLSEVAVDQLIKRRWGVLAFVALFEVIVVYGG